MHYLKRFSLLLLAGLLLGVQPAPTPQTLRQGKDFALFFAVNDYEDPAWKDLRNPIGDAEVLAEKLTSQYGFRTEIHRNPTRNQILETLSQWQKKSFASDAQLLVFFSGHGTFSDFSNDGYFIPREGKAVDEFNYSHFPLSQMGNAVTKIPCSHVLLAIDACYSGTIDRVIAFKDGPPRPNRYQETSDTERDRKLRQFLTNDSRYLLTSGGKERTPDGDEHSPFTEGFLSALRANYSLGDGLLTWPELLGYLQEVSPTPHYGTLVGHKEGNFVFVRQGGAPAPQSASNIQNDYLTAVTCGTAACYETFLSRYTDSKDPLVKAAQSQLAALKTNPTDLPPGPEMVFIEGGTFTMGSTDGEDDEKPPHQVSVSDFYLAKYETSVSLFRDFVDATGYRTDAEKMGGSYFWIDGAWKLKEGVDWRCDAEGNIRPANEYNHPVLHVSWNDAKAYCDWLSRETGQRWRLPTEAEWEYAAGNGSRHTRYSWGNGQPSGKQGGNVADESKSPEGKTWTNKFEGYNDGYWFTAPVGSYNANQLGLHDMSGNVWEWCSDWYGKDYYASSPTRDPQGPASGSFRVNRGGSWDGSASLLRVADRSNGTPVLRLDNLGFRPARTP